ncbi:hypothetical protein SUGI_1041140 [Cryptomeria japonica]|nr:hypothetical protein SUGI_1041140 [Cryptomeria japonica]
MGYDGHSAFGFHKKGVQEKLQPLLQPWDTTRLGFNPSSGDSSKLEIPSKHKRTTSKITPSIRITMSIANQPTRSKFSSYENTSQFTTSKQKSYVACQTITLGIKLFSTSDTQATSTTSSDKTLAAPIDKPFTLADIPITNSDRVLPSDSKMDSHEYKWDSSFSQPSDGDTFEVKKVKGDAFIKTFWDLVDEDTSTTDRSHLEPDYEEDSTDDDLGSSILTITDASYELNLINEAMPIIHPELIKWNQQDPPHLDTFQNDDAIIYFLELRDDIPSGDHKVGYAIELNSIAYFGENAKPFNHKKITIKIGPSSETILWNLWK